MLRYKGRALHHKRGIWNNLSVTPNGDVIMVGLGVYMGHTEDLFDDDGIILFDRTTTTINVWHQSILVATQTVIMDTAQARIESLRAIVPHTTTVAFERPPILELGQAYDIEHNLLPTDVTNHFSGAPITIMGADLWTCYGSQEDNTNSCLFSSWFKVSSCMERRRGRCCVENGQLPYILYWPLL
jgi:hypothetical protein